MTAAVVLAAQFWSFVDQGKWPEARALFADGFRADWPQTEEEVLGADRYIEVNRELLRGAKCILLEATGVEDWAFTRVLIVKGERTLSNWATRDGRLTEAVEYFPDPKHPKYEAH